MKHDEDTIVIKENEFEVEEKDIEISSYKIDKPNILFLVADQLRFDWIDDYYYPNNLILNTPTITELQLNGIRFMNVLSGSPTCVPSRGTMASGMEYDKLGMMSNANDWPSKNIKSFYNYLQENGYWTMITGKDDLTKNHGVDIDGNYRIKQIGFNDQRRCHGKLDIDKRWPKIKDPFSKYLHDVNKSNYIHQCYKQCDELQLFCKEPCNLNDDNDKSYHDNWITQQTLDILDNKPNDNSPWFLQVNFAGPHVPYLITTKIENKYNKYKNRTFPETKKYVEIEELNNYLQLNNDKAREQYSLEIENLDEQISIIIDKLYELNEYEMTIICLSSDHGDMLGDADDFGKFKPWIQSTNVPLICCGPNIIKNTKIKTYVSLIDIAATFLEIGGIQTIPNNMDSISLKPFLNGTWNDNDNGYKKYVLSGLNPWRLAIKEINSSVIWKFICCVGNCVDRRFRKYYKNGKSELLYNVAIDLYEQNNIAHLYPQIVEEMKEFLTADGI